MWASYYGHTDIVRAFLSAEAHNYRPAEGGEYRKAGEGEEEEEPNYDRCLGYLV